MKFRIKIIVILIAVIIGTSFVTGCEKKTISEANNNTNNNVDKTLLKNNREEAESEIKIAVENLFKEVYGDKITDSRIYVDMVYSTKDEQENETVKAMNLGSDQVLFHITYDLKPANKKDIINLTIPDGEYDEESGWIVNISRFGTLTPNDNNDSKYKIINFGTGL